MTTARALIDRSFVWDNHACMPLRPQDTSFLPQIERARDAGFDAVTVNIGFGERSPEEHLAMLSTLTDWFGGKPDRYRIVRAPADLDAARADGQLAIAFDIEGARGVGDRLDLVREYRRRGVLWMLIAYNRENLAGYGIYDVSDEGLKPFGRALVRAMEAAGMTVCLSHTGHRTARDVLAMAEKPVIFSHSNADAAHPHKRNIPDDLIRACAATGGVIGVNGVGDFLRPRGGAFAEAIVRHTDHIVQLVGPSHAAIALDYVYDLQELVDFLAVERHSFPEGFDPEVAFAPPEVLEDVVSGLIARGYPEADIQAIVGGSWRRVFEAASA